MKIERIIVGKGKSVPVDGPDGEWSKQYYQVEALLTEVDNIQLVKEDLSNMLEYWLSEAKPEAPMDTEFEALPWREFKNRKGAWIFTNESGAEDLRNKLEAASGKTLEIGDYKYTISGDQGQFISRFKKPEQEAR